MVGGSFTSRDDHDRRRTGVMLSVPVADSFDVSVECTWRSRMECISTLHWRQAMQSDSLVTVRDSKTGYNFVQGGSN